jgi:hypothetical protein
MSLGIRSRDAQKHKRFAYIRLVQGTIEWLETFQTQTFQSTNLGRFMRFSGKRSTRQKDSCRMLLSGHRLLHPF